MTKQKSKLLTAIMIVLLLGLSGCGGIKHHYPVWSIPERPEFVFSDEGDHCLSENDLRQLNEYVLHLEAAVKKYEMEINVINTGEPE
ncbi:MAG: hypothetical protein IIA62_01000 [Nitrospinae bacterium]|nr:hypothetical protein [Nitrospinota bacterium]